jgi:hypothetical protein
MPLSHVGPPALLQIRERTPRGRPFPKKCLMHILKTVLTYTPHHDLITFLVPLENRPRTNTQLSTDLGRDRDLALRSQLRNG